MYISSIILENIPVCVYIYIYIYIQMHLYVYIYIYISTSYDVLNFILTGI